MCAYIGSSRLFRVCVLLGNQLCRRRRRRLLLLQQTGNRPAFIGVLGNGGSGSNKSYPFSCEREREREREEKSWVRGRYIRRSVANILLWLHNTRVTRMCVCICIHADLCVCVCVYTFRRAARARKTQLENRSGSSIAELFARRATALGTACKNSRPCMQPFLREDPTTFLLLLGGRRDYKTAVIVVVVFYA